MKFPASDMMTRLHEMLAKSISDEKIIEGATLTESGYAKAARRLGIDPSEVAPLMGALASRLRDERLIESEMSEAIGSVERFSFEKDYMKNVTVRDNQTGKKALLRGSEAAALLNRIGAGADEQQTLARYVGIMETTETVQEAVELDEDETFHHEIHSAHGAYNFPWRSNGKRGHGTARFKGRGSHQMDIKLLSIRDDEGEEMEVDEAMKQHIHEQAIAFIGNE
jgi:hypothetical protein